MQHFKSDNYQCITADYHMQVHIQCEHSQQYQDHSKDEK